MAAVSPTLFQYSKGARRRASSSSGAREAGKIFVSSAHRQTITVPASTPYISPDQRVGTSRTSATAPTATPR
jgi:hypothetical protein